MPDFVKVIIIAVIQGLTEFLPVSSSAHSVFARHLLNLHSTGADLEIALHLGTLFSVLVFYRRRVGGLLLGLLKRETEALRYFMLLFLASMPALLVYTLFHDQIESYFGNPAATAGLLCMTGVGLLMMKLTEKRPSDPVGPGAAFRMGVAQACALLPGISRSGATLLAARAAGTERRAAVEFSLLMSVIAVTAAVILKMFHQSPGAMTFGYGTLGLGVAVSAVVGYAAISWLVKLMEANRLWLIGCYCLAAGALAWWFFTVTGS